MKEIWKDIPGYEGFYQISNLGTVKSLERTIFSESSSVKQRVLKEKVIQPHLSGDSTKYPTIQIQKDGKKQKFKIHLLLLELFKGKRPSPDHVARHLNDNPMDFSLSNLEWGTHSQNMKDKFVNGYVHHGKKLSDIEIEKIKKDNRTQRDIAADYGVNQKTIWRIKNGK